jgi:hypothetical protein
MFFIPKLQGSFRAVVDYQPVHECTELVPLPGIHLAFHWFTKASYFTALNLNQVYHQIPLAESSKQYIVFYTDWNLYQCTQVPFGLITGPQMMARLLDHMLQDIKFEYIYHYLHSAPLFLIFLISRGSYGRTTKAHIHNMF